MRTTLTVANSGCEAGNILWIGIIPLHRDLNFDFIANLCEINRRRMQGGLIAIQVLNERGDAALVHEVVAFTLASLVDQRDRDTFVQKG